MPELPEVEVVRREMMPLVTGKTIRKVEIIDHKITLSPNELVGKTIEWIDRKGKFLFFHLSGESVLMIHLGMTGSLVCDENSPGHPHHRMSIECEDGVWLLYRDQRRFGKIRYLEKEAWRALWQRIGLDPLSSEYEVGHVIPLFSNRTSRIKDFLLDQRCISGIGNIYACEILFRTGIHPEKRVNQLTPTEIVSLYRMVPQVLEEAIAGKGTTFRDFRRLDGRGGEYQEHLCVYGRAGLPCPRCGQVIERIRFSNRSSFFCPQCQAI